MLPRIIIFIVLKYVCAVYRINLLPVYEHCFVVFRFVYADRMSFHCSSVLCPIIWKSLLNCDCPIATPSLNSVLLIQLIMKFPVVRERDVS